jgi:hypothetical protein
MLLNAGYGMREAVHTESRSYVLRASDEQAKLLVDDDVR